MNHYSELLRYIKQIAEQDEYINTITQGEELDIYKSSIHPLLNIDINTGRFTNGKTIVFNVELTCLDIRDKNPEVETDKFTGNDNIIDSLNNTLASLSRIWNILYIDLNDENITSSENPNFEKIMGADKDILDGWSLTFEVEMPNTKISLCNNDF